jgi:hypothetical protein
MYRYSLLLAVVQVGLQAGPVVVVVVVLYMETQHLA